MLLYDLFYPGRDMDSACPLPKASSVEGGTRARCVNGERKWVIARGGEWADFSPCSAPGCHRRGYAKGLCESHYSRAYRAEKRGEEPDLSPVRDAPAPAREVLSLRVSPAAKAQAARDPEGARGAVEEWARSPPPRPADGCPDEGCGGRSAQRDPPGARAALDRWAQRSSSE